MPKIDYSNKRTYITLDQESKDAILFIQTVMGKASASEILREGVKRYKKVIEQIATKGDTGVFLVTRAVVTGLIDDPNSHPGSTGLKTKHAKSPDGKYACVDCGKRYSGSRISGAHVIVTKDGWKCANGCTEEL